MARWLYILLLTPLLLGARVKIYTDTQAGDPADCNAAGEYALAFDTNTGVWRKCVNGTWSDVDDDPAAAAAIPVEEDNAQVLLATSFDFLGADFDVTDASGEADIDIADAIARDAEVAAAYQPLEATLTDIADGTIAENLVNTANPWADNEVADDITASSYLPLAGGTLTGDLVLSADASEGLSGGGLTDCDADNQTVSWDSTTKKFGCGDDDAGAGSTGTLTYHVEGFTGCCGTTEYMGPGSNTANCNATIGNVDTTHAGPTLTVGGLKCRQKTDSTCVVTFTLMKNGSASAASTCTSTNIASCAASTTTDTIANGDTWAIRANDDSANCGTGCELSCDFTATY